MNNMMSLGKAEDVVVTDQQRECPDLTYEEALQRAVDTTSLADLVGTSLHARAYRLVLHSRGVPRR